MSEKGADYYRLPSLAATGRFGTELGALLKSGDLVAMNGDLGSGKTTMTRALARGMGLAGPVSSPTFALVQEYRGTVPLFHFDPYRLETLDDMVDIGFEEYLERNGVIVVEWAERIVPLLPPERIELTLSAEAPDEFDAEESARVVTLAARGERATHVARMLTLALPDLLTADSSRGAA